MGAIIKQLKKGNSKPGMGKASPSPLNPALMEAWNSGFSQGVKQQREADIQKLVDLLTGMEDVPGFGPKTVEKIQKHFMDKFGWES